MAAQHDAGADERRSGARGSASKTLGGTESVSTVRIEGRDYCLVVGSDLDRDGMFLECTPESDGTTVLVEVFYSDKDGSFTITTSGDALPLALVRFVIAEAERRLPPSSRRA